MNGGGGGGGEWRGDSLYIFSVYLPCKKEEPATQEKKAEVRPAVCCFSDTIQSSFDVTQFHKPMYIYIYIYQR